MASNVIQFPIQTANDNPGEPTPPPPYAGAPNLRLLTGGAASGSGSMTTGRLYGAALHSQRHYIHQCP